MRRNIQKFFKNRRNVRAAVIGIYLLLILLYVVIVSLKNDTEVNPEEVSYVEFLNMMEEGKVDTVFYSGEEYIEFTLLNEDTKDMTPEERDTYVYEERGYRKTLSPRYSEFAKDVLETGARFKIVNNESSMWMIVDFLPSVFIIILTILILRMMFVNGSLKQKDLIKTSEVRFMDVIGQEEIMGDVKFIADLIKNPAKGESIGAKAPRGVLLSGPPGTGKTLIAKAIAGEAGVPFLYMNASSFIELYVGMGAKRVRQLFKIAKANTPCVIFIDEIDAVGGKRAGHGRSSEDDKTINALLQELDGFDERAGIFVIAATNRPDILDDALKRSGRFDRQIEVSLPRDFKVRSDLFYHFLKDKRLAEDIDIESIAKQVMGFSGADIEAICNEASLIAMMRGKASIDTSCLEEAVDKKVFKGNRKSQDEINTRDNTIIAYHEAGHAVMTWLSKREIARASIIGTTSGVGGAVFQAEASKQLMTNKELRDQIKICYAGRASEEIQFGEITTGAANDITQATKYLTLYTEKYGFDKQSGLIDMEDMREKAFLNGYETVKRVSELSLELYNETVEILRENFGKVRLLANALLKHETLTGAEIEALFTES